MAMQADSHALNKLLTLTLDPKLIPTGADSFEHIRSVWAKFRIYLRREGTRRGYKKPVSFIAVVELQKSGVAHMHVLLNRYVDQAWISQAWNALGGGYIIDIRHVDAHRVSHYLAKYMTKSSQALPAKVRRYSTSRDISLFGKREKTGWWLLKHSIELILGRTAGDLLLLEEYDGEENLESFTFVDREAAN